MSKERLEEMNKLKNIINSLDDSVDADDFHKFVDTCQINYEEGVFNEILRFMQSQAERVKELEEENIQLNNEMEGLLQKIEDKEPYYSMKCLKLEQQNKRYREVLERQFGEFWEACVKVVGEDMAYDIVAEMPEECEE